MQEPLEGLPSSSASRAWRSCDLLSALDRLADVGLAPQVLRMLDAPTSACPELLLLSLAACSPEWGTLHAQVRAERQRLCAPCPCAGCHACYQAAEQAARSTISPSVCSPAEHSAAYYTARALGIPDALTSWGFCAGYAEAAGGRSAAPPNGQAGPAAPVADQQQHLWPGPGGSGRVRAGAAAPNLRCCPGLPTHGRLLSEGGFALQRGQAVCRAKTP